eukprot:scaffold102230_cov52-Phaeocystis_antarctica.AAC.1
MAILTMAIFGASAREASFQKLEGITNDIFSRSPGRWYVVRGQTDRQTDNLVERHTAVVGSKWSVVSSEGHLLALSWYTTTVSA